MLPTPKVSAGYDTFRCTWAPHRCPTRPNTCSVYTKGIEHLFGCQVEHMFGPSAKTSYTHRDDEEDP